VYPGFVKLGDFGGFSGKSPRPGEWISKSRVHAVALMICLIFTGRWEKSKNINSNYTYHVLPENHFTTEVLLSFLFLLHVFPPKKKPPFVDPEDVVIPKQRCGFSVLMT
jgi:hypothetical protein